MQTREQQIKALKIALFQYYEKFCCNNKEEPWAYFYVYEMESSYLQIYPECKFARQINMNDVLRIEQCFKSQRSADEMRTTRLTLFFEGLMSTEQFDYRQLLQKWINRQGFLDYLQQMDDIKKSTYKIIKKQFERQNFSLETSEMINISQVSKKLKNFIGRQLNSSNFSLNLNSKLKAIIECLQNQQKGFDFILDVIQQQANQDPKLILICQLIKSIQHILHNFSENDLCEVTFKQRKIQFINRTPLRLIKMAFGITLINLDFYILMAPSGKIIDNIPIDKIATLQVLKQVTILFEGETYLIKLPQIIDLTKLHHILKFHLDLISTEIICQQISSDVISVTEIFELEIIYTKQQRCSKFKERGDGIIERLKQDEKYKEIISIPKDSQIWSINDEPIQDSSQLYKFKNQSQKITIWITEVENLNYYGFSQSKSIFHKWFKDFTFEDDQYFLDLIDKNDTVQYPLKNFQDVFRQISLKYIFSTIKKHSPIEKSFNHIENDIVGVSNKNNHKLWKPCQIEHENYFNQTYIIYNLIKSSTLKLKIDIIRNLMYNYPIPFVYFQKEKNTILYQEHYWIQNKALNIASLTIKDQKVNGKSTLLNYLFEAKFPIREQIHSECRGGVSISYNILQNDQQYTNLIDISNDVDQTTKVQLVKYCNMIIIHSLYISSNKAKQQIHQIKQWLNENNINLPVLICFRDLPNNAFEKMKNIQSSSLIISEQNLKVVNFVKINKKTMQNYNRVFGILISQIHQFIKQSFISQKQYLWKFVDMLAEKSTKNHELLNLLLKKLQKNKSQHSKIIDLYIEKFFVNKWFKNEERLRKQDQIKTKACQIGLSQIVKEIIIFCKNNQEYTIQIIKKIRLFLTLLKNEMFKGFNEIQQILSERQHNISVAKVKVSSLFAQLIKFNSNLMTEKMKQSIQKFTNNGQQYNNYQNLKSLLKSIKKQFYYEIYPKSFSIQIFWRQLIYMYKFKPDYTFKFNDNDIKLETEIIALGRKLIQQSESFQLINGDLLDMPVQFFKKIFQNFQHKKIMVIAIVGPQSSGKSTLLNHVLGCDFMSSVGRCTKGIYGTYFEITNRQKFKFEGILVLDTQGLMSNYQSKRYDNRHNFDLKLLLFCLRISDVVIFNNQGDIKRQCRPLLEITFDPQLLHIQNLPDIIFVLNMNPDKINQKQIEQLQIFRSTIININERAQQYISRQNFTALSYAFIENQQNSNVSPHLRKYINSKKVPSKKYYKQTKQFSKKLQRLLIKRYQRQEYSFKTFQKVVQDMNQIWYTINTYPILTKFTNKKFKAIFKRIQEWKKQANEELITYLKDRSLKFMQIPSLSALNIDEHKTRQMGLYEQKVNMQIEEFKNLFHDQNYHKEMDIKIFVDDELLSGKLFLLGQKALIEEYANKVKVMLEIKEQQNNHTQFDQLIKQTIIKKNNQALNEQIMKESFDTFWKNKLSIYEKKIKREVIAEKMYERHLQMYNKCLNESYKMQRTYQINNIYSQQNLKKSYLEYRPMIIERFHQMFEDKLYLTSSYQSPIFNLPQGQNYHSEFIFLNMEQFYQINQVNKYIKFNQKTLNKQLNMVSIYSFIHERVLCSQFVHKIIQQMLSDLKILGISLKFQILQCFIVNKMIIKFWDIELLELNQEKQFRQNIIIQLSKEKSIIKMLKEAIHRITQKDLTEFRYQSQFITIPRQFCLPKSNYSNPTFSLNSNIPEQMSNFELRRTKFQQSLILLKQTIEKNRSIFKEEKHLNNKSIIKIIILQLLNIYMDNIKNDKNKNTQRFIAEFNNQKKKINDELQQQFNSILGEVNLKIIPSNNFPKQLSFKNKTNKSISHFSSYQYFMKTLNSFNKYWNIENLNDFFDKNNARKDECCSVSIKQIQIKPGFQNQIILSTYKDKNIQEFLKNVDQNIKFLRFITGYIEYDHIFQKIQDFIERSSVSSQTYKQINELIRVVNGCINAFNSDIKQISQKLNYHFQIQLHSLAFHLFWKRKEEISWEDIHQQITKSDPSSLKVIFESQVFGRVKQTNAQYAKILIKKMQQYIINEKDIQRTKFKEKLINNYAQKMKKEHSITKVIENIIDKFSSQITKVQTIQQFKIQKQALQQQIKNFLLKTAQYIKKYYRVNYQEKQVQKMKSFSSEINQNIVKQLTQQLCSTLRSLINSQLFKNKITSTYLLSDLKKFLSQILLGKNQGQNTFMLKMPINTKFIQRQLEAINFTDIQVFIQQFIVQLKDRTLQCNENVDQVEKQIKNFKIQIITQICQQRCPCCKNICDINMYRYTKHQTHQCSLGHNFRAIGGFFVESTKNQSKIYYPSFLKCEQLYDNFCFIFDNESTNWSSFKQRFSKWNFNSNSIIKQKMNMALIKIWNFAGMLICDSYNQKFQPYSQNNQSQIDNNHVNYIFALDESSSMNGAKWLDLKQTLKNQIEQIKQISLNSQISIIKFNATIEIFAQDQKVSDIKLDQIKQRGGSTNFTPVFKKVNDMVEKDKNKRHVFIFVTDGLAEYPSKQIERLKMYQKWQQSRGLGCHYMSIYIKQHDNSSKSDLLDKINQQLNGFHQNISKMLTLKQAMKEVQIKINSIINVSGSFRVQIS